MTTSEGQTQAALQSRLADGSLAGSWALDPARSAATLRTKAIWGLVPVKGAFREIEGSGSVSPAGEVTGRIALVAGSLDTGNKKRDTHLNSEEFFLTEKYPAITFILDKLAPASEGVTVSGTLTVRDQSRPISFPASVTIGAGGEATVDATVQVDRSEFGLGWSQMGASLKNAVTIHAVFTKS
jgi:polyisoprenoid-binding protein YceI